MLSHRLLISSETESSFVSTKQTFTFERLFNFLFSEDWSLIPNDDLFEEDDLGFDPFHETQKALAEMIESESKQVIS